MHGFERPAWDNAVQFKTRIFDRGPFSADSGFQATFRFQVSDPAVLPGLELALENPMLYRISVNEREVSFEAGNPLAGSENPEHLNRRRLQGWSEYREDHGSAV